MFRTHSQFPPNTFSSCDMLHSNKKAIPSFQLLRPKTAMNVDPSLSLSPSILFINKSCHLHFKIYPRSVHFFLLPLLLSLWTTNISHLNYCNGLLTSSLSPIVYSK